MSYLKHLTDPYLRQTISRDPSRQGFRYCFHGVYEDNGGKYNLQYYVDRFPDKGYWCVCEPDAWKILHEEDCEFLDKLLDKQNKN